MRLTKISNWFWFWLVFIIIFTFVIIFVIFTYKIEKTEKIIVYFDENKKMHIFGNDRLIYNLKKDQKIMLNLNEINHELFIKSIKMNKDSIAVNYFVSDNNFFKIIKPNSKLGANLFLGETTLFNRLFNY
ncbi:hypothetical protein LAD74_02650 [Mycoplasma sp. U97]|uniref:MAG1140 family protein n=1 Tax=Mycoplasma tauri TaxID=547987 RepID=UPI001CBC12CB|nr:hypothetical protein [Mycoplasma tauri]MBZ4212871.1 hypothetical protein [Mycoplasma tauri]